MDPREGPQRQGVPNGSPASETVQGAQSKSKQKGNDKPKDPRPKRPNYNEIHAKALPVEVHPLPAFIPHNPLSVVRIAIAIISSRFWPPASHVRHRGYFSPETQSIHVTDPKSIRALWEQGFWGSGSLSRTEPQWLDHEKRKLGLADSKTAWEITQARREERRQFKLERARKEREDIEEQLRKEGKLDLTKDVDDTAMDGTISNDMNGATASLFEAVDSVPTEAKETGLEPSDEIEDQEHLQLTPEEAFFLTYALDALQVYQDGSALCLAHLLRLYCVHSTFPIPQGADAYLEVVRIQSRKNFEPPAAAAAEHISIAPDNTFLLKYIVYHHFRSLGWVVRDGVKFAVDYLLYNRGPVFSHAQFTLMILPSYSHPYWSATPERRAECEKKASRDWWWLHRVNRVQTSVMKTLMLVYVDVPPPWDEVGQSKSLDINIGEVLKKYTVREFVVQRWTPNRHRD